MDFTMEEIEQARTWVREKPSTSFLQRKMQIGYNRAAVLMLMMEAEERVSHPASNGTRTILR
jgi:DNA segregation ATPase FtsK/SpoIIIE-like protein